MTAKPASRAVRFQQLCRAAAKRLHTKVSDDRVQHCATLQLARETFLARLIDGRDADPAVLLRLDKSLRALMPPVEPLKVEIEYVGSLDFCPSCKGRVPDRLTDITCCPHCGWRPNAVATPTPPTPPAPETLTDAVPKPDKRSSVPASNRDNVVPLRSSQHP